MVLVVQYLIDEFRYVILDQLFTSTETQTLVMSDTVLQDVYYHNETEEVKFVYLEEKKFFMVSNLLYGWNIQFSKSCVFKFNNFLNILQDRSICAIQLERSLHETFSLWLPEDVNFLFYSFKENIAFLLIQQTRTVDTCIYKVELLLDNCLNTITCFAPMSHWLSVNSGVRLTQQRSQKDGKTQLEWHSSVVGGKVGAGSKLTKKISEWLNINEFRVARVNPVFYKYGGNTGELLKKLKMILEANFRCLKQ
jgi:hypothetical protein